MYVFDVDGCLADTLPVVRWAYIAAGAEATEEDVKHPWSQWLPRLVGGVSRAEEVRKRKTELYIAALRQIPPRPLPRTEFARALLDAGDPAFAVSAAHPDVVPVVLDSVGLGDMPILGCEVSPPERVGLLLDLSSTGSYYDDDAHTCLIVRAFTPWKAVQV